MIEGSSIENEDTGQNHIHDAHVNANSQSSPTLMPTDENSDAVTPMGYSLPLEPSAELVTDEVRIDVEQLVCKNADVVEYVFYIVR